MKRLPVLFLTLIVLAGFAWAAPPANETLTATTPVDVDVIDEEEANIAKLEALAARLRSAQSQVARWQAAVTRDTAAIASMSARIKRSLAFKRPGWILPVASLTDATIDKGTAGKRTVYWSRSADTFRNPPPP